MRILYEAGVQCPTIPGGRSAEADMRVAALFLKRTLTDFRAGWLLVISGYTSQGATVAASLWEHAVAAQVIAGHPDRAEKYLKTRGPELPWPPKKLARLAAMGESDAEDAAAQMHVGYKWLCKAKHPTGPTALHDAGSTALSPEYVVMAAPDGSDEDLSRKGIVLLIMFSRLYSALERFPDANDADTRSSVYEDFANRLELAHSRMLTAHALNIADLPYQLSDFDD